MNPPPNRLANYHAPWTPDQDAELRRLVREDGLNAAQIAPLMGRTRDGVYSRGNAIGVRFGRGNRPDVYFRARVCDLLRLGISLAEVARRTGRTNAGIYDVARRMLRDGALVRTGPAKGSPGYNPRKVRFSPAA